LLKDAVFRSCQPSERVGKEAIVVYIDDAHVGQHRQAFHDAAKRFGQVHQSNSFSVSSPGMGPKGFEMLIWVHGDERTYSVVVQITGDLSSRF